MTARTVVHHVVDISTGGDSTLRVALVIDGEAAPALLLAHGLGTDESFRRPAWCGSPIHIPASVLPELRHALDTLEGTER